MIRAPGFWWKEPGLAAALLSPLAAIYGNIAARRMTQPGARVGIPILCVGNPTVGGAGKTPLAMTVARRLAAAGERPVMLSRGYGRSARGPVQVDPSRHGAAEVGDEPLLLARVAPTIVAVERVGHLSQQIDLCHVVHLDLPFPSIQAAETMQGSTRFAPCGRTETPRSHVERNGQSVHQSR